MNPKPEQPAEQLPADLDEKKRLACLLAWFSGHIARLESIGVSAEDMRRLREVYGFASIGIKTFTELGDVYPLIIAQEGTDYWEQLRAMVRKGGREMAASRN